MAIFKSQDFKDILYPVHTVKSGVDPREAFPHLLDYSEFALRTPKELPFKKVFNFIVYAYDQKSPFFTQVEDFVDRKKQAVLEAGFQPDNEGDFSDQVKGMLNCENKVVNMMIIRYCRIQGKDFANLIASMEAFHQINYQLLSNVTVEGDDAIVVAKRKADLDKAADDLNKRLNEKARRFLSQEIAEGLHDDLWSLAEKETTYIRLSPEDYAD